MQLEDSQHFLSQTAGKKSVQTAAAGICIAVLAGAAAGFCLAVKLGKHKQKIESGCCPAVPNSDGALADAAVGAPDKSGKLEKQSAPQ